MPPAQRKLLTDYMKEQEQNRARVCAGTGLIFESVVMKMMLTAIFWVRHPPQEVRVFNTLIEATRWATQVMARQRPPDRTEAM